MLALIENLGIQNFGNKIKNFKKIYFRTWNSIHWLKIADYP